VTNVAAAASVVIAKPVKWVETRTENLTTTGFARDYHMDVEIGATKDGKVTAFIEDKDPEAETSTSGAAEGVAADAKGNVYGARVRQKVLIKYAKQ